MKHFSFIKLNAKLYEKLQAEINVLMLFKNHCINENKLHITISISGTSQVSSCETKALLFPFFIGRKSESENEMYSQNFVLFD